MDRRAAGLLALLLAVAAVVFVPRALSAGVAGQASAAPMALPPAIGTCVSLVTRPTRIVDCAEPHSGEITATWVAGQPVPSPVDNGFGPVDVCVTAAAEYLGDVATTQLRGFDLTVITTDTRLIRAPRAQRAGDYGWRACVVRAPYRGVYTGSLRNPPMTSRPGVFGSCASLSLGAVACTQAHSAEQLGTTTGWFYDNTAGRDPADREVEIKRTLSTKCTELAADLTGNPDPTYGGALRLDSQVVQLADDITWGDPSIFGTRYTATCELISTGAALTDSVVGLGLGALPTA